MRRRRTENPADEATKCRLLDYSDGGRRRRLPANKVCSTFGVGTHALRMGAPPRTLGQQVLIVNDRMNGFWLRGACLRHNGYGRYWQALSLYIVAKMFGIKLYE